jgi:predicted YcjX-like family ATPase
LPALSLRLAGRSMRVRLAASGADAMPRFDPLAKSASLAVDPPSWPRPTDAVSVLELDIDIDQPGTAGALWPPSRLRLEIFDYPGEWLLDLPMLGQSFATWSDEALLRLDTEPEAGAFLGFLRGLPPATAADEALAHTGHELYVAALRALQAKGRAMLQPGRFLMPPPGAAPPWMMFFPITGACRLATLMAQRFDAYRAAVRSGLADPGFARVDRLVVLADILGALHAGPLAFADQALALGRVAAALQRRPPLPLLPSWLQPWGIGRIAFAASKADHVARGQRANLVALLRSLTELGGEVTSRAFALAAIACTEDFTWTLDGRPVSAVRGHVAGQGVLRSYPGEVPDRAPDGGYWAHPFLSLPDFAPKRLEPGGRGAIPQLALDELLVFLLEDVL